MSRHKYLCFVLYIIVQVVNLTSCEEGSTLAFAIDDTGSMRDDISEVRKQSKAIMDIVKSSNATLIDNMVLVSINDPYSSLRINTKRSEEFIAELNRIYVHGGGDCEEMSLTGIKVALEHSKQGSYVYVFTDASAKDAYQVNAVKDLCQKKQSQVIFVLTGDCNDRRSTSYRVYYDVAKACSGQVFRVTKNEVGSILEVVKSLLRAPTSVFKWTNVPPTNKFVPVLFELDEKAEYALISASGTDVDLKITSTGISYGPQPEQKQTLWKSNAKAIELVNPRPGTYYAWVKGDSTVSVVVYGRTDFTFDYGFSILEPKSINDATKQPIAGAKQHVSINVTDPDHSVEIKTLRILDINNKDAVITELPLRDNGNGFYITAPFVAPTSTFRIAVTGEIKRNRKEIVRYSKTNINPRFVDLTPKSAPVVDILEGSSVDAMYGADVTLTCNVRAHPRPDISWYTAAGALIPTQSSEKSKPDYISYLKVNQVTKRNKYICRARNSLSVAEKSVQVNVLSAFKTIPKEIVSASLYKDKTLRCGITSHLPIQRKWLKAEKRIMPSEHFSISSDGSEMTLKSVSVDLQGRYTCVATLSSDPTESSSRSIEVVIPGLAAPKIKPTNRNVQVKEGERLSLDCGISSGYPKPKVQWVKVRPGGSQIPADSEVFTVDRSTFQHAGQYKCTVTNPLGTTSATFDVIVAGPPKIVMKEAAATLPYNSAKTLVCEGEAYPPPTVEWRDAHGNRVAQQQINQLSEYRFLNTLKLENLRRTAIYTCVISNTHGSVSDKVSITILSPFNIYNHISGTNDIQYGDSKTLQCDIRSKEPMSITWYIQRTGTKSAKHIIMSSDKYDVSRDGTELTIQSMDLNMDGQYTCEASLKADTNEKVTYTMNVNVVGLQKPIITSMPNSYFGLEGDLVMRVICDVTGCPKPTIVWKMGDKVVTPDTKHVIINGTLFINNPVISDTEDYTCEATNEIGSDTRSFSVAISDFIEDINYMGEIHDVIVEQGNPKVLKCDLQGPKIESIRWYKDGVLTTQTGGIYTIDKVSSSEEGNYTCRANTAEGSTSGTYVVYIGYPPIFDDDTSPVAITWEDSQQILDCTADAQPPAKYEWFHNGKLMTAGYNLVQHRIPDWGDYTCNVHNELGSIQKSFKVNTDGCFVTNTVGYTNQPLATDEHLPAWKYLMSNSGIKLKENEEIKFSCPRNTRTTNSFKIAPNKQEIIAKCITQDKFSVAGKTYKYSELQCEHRVEASVEATGEQCAGDRSEMVRVGFPVNGYLEVYGVCYNKQNNVPIYVNTSAPALTMGSGADTAQLEWSSTPELGEHTSGDWEPAGACQCCYTKEALLDTNELPFGPAQAATFKNNLNSVAVWNPTCDGDDHSRMSWQSVNKELRDIYRLYQKVSTWTGASEYTYINGRLVPRYLWKVAALDGHAAVLVYVNTRAPHASDVRCSAPCDALVPPDRGLYCCDPTDFQDKFHVPIHIDKEIY